MPYHPYNPNFRDTESDPILNNTPTPVNIMQSNTQEEMKETSGFKPVNDQNELEQLANMTPSGRNKLN